MGWKTYWDVKHWVVTDGDSVQNEAANIYSFMDPASDRSNAYIKEFDIAKMFDSSDNHAPVTERQIREKLARGGFGTAPASNTNILTGSGGINTALFPNNSTLGGGSMFGSGGAPAATNKSLLAGISSNVVGLFLMIGALLALVVYFFKQKSPGRNMSRWCLLFLLAGATTLNAQVSNNGIKQLQSDWNAVAGVTAIRNKPTSFNPDSARFATLWRVGSLYVPYTGATQDINIGSHNISSYYPLFGITVQWSKSWGFTITQPGHYGTMGPGVFGMWNIVGAGDTVFSQWDNYGFRMNVGNNSKMQYAYLRPRLRGISDGFGGWYLPKPDTSGTFGVPITLADSAKVLAKVDTAAMLYPYVRLKQSTFTFTIPGATLTNVAGRYTRIGDMVTCVLTYTVTGYSVSQPASIVGLPFNFSASTLLDAHSIVYFGDASFAMQFKSEAGTNYGYLYKLFDGEPVNTDTYTGKFVTTITYFLN
jgi:hypothetical protein